MKWIFTYNPFKQNLSVILLFDSNEESYFQPSCVIVAGKKTLRHNKYLIFKVY